MFRPPTTVQYPDRLPRPLVDTLPERYRGFLEVDLATCTGCKACERDCPINVIAIDLEKLPEAEGGQRVMTRFDIDMAKCCYCNLCTIPCPTECLQMTPKYENSVYNRANLLYHYSTYSPADAARIRAEAEKREAEEAEKRKAAAAAKAAAAKAAAKEPAAKTPAAKAVATPKEPVAEPAE
jgi:NADH-quinone oxidoreductase subunit I